MVAFAKDDGKHVSWLVRNETVSQELQQEYEVPSFLSPYQRKGVFVSERNGSEYIFTGLQHGQGRELHVDYRFAYIASLKQFHCGSCNSVWSAQITGTKRWRLLSPDHPRNVMRMEAGGIESAGPGEAYEAVLLPGDVIVWYAGWTHGTFALEAPTLALSVEFLEPAPRANAARHAALFRAHSELRGSYTSCLRSWGVDDHSEL